MAKKKPAKKQEVMAVKIQIEPTAATPVFYMNYAEIAHSQHDFVLLSVRVPAKIDSVRQTNMRETGTLILEPEVQLTFPPTLVRPLIDALEKQLKSYELVMARKGSKNGEG